MNVFFISSQRGLFKSKLFFENATGTKNAEIEHVLKGYAFFNETAKKQ